MSESRTDKLRRTLGQGFVYFVYSPTFRLMKIGRTKGAFNTGRWNQYVSESPERLVPVLVIGSHMDLESVIHEALVGYRSHGEWFEWEPSLEIVRETLRGWPAWDVVHVLHAPMADAITDGGRIGFPLRLI